MFSKIKNLIIFLVIAAVLVLAYIFFFKKDPENANLVSSNNTVPVFPNINSPVSQKNSTTNQDFLTILLNVNNIKLSNSIFGDPAFTNLRDTTIVLMPDGTEGRPNPFAPIGVDDNFSEGNASPLIQVNDDLGASLTSPIGFPANTGNDTGTTAGIAGVESNLGTTGNTTNITTTGNVTGAGQ